MTLLGPCSHAAAHALRYGRCETEAAFSPSATPVQPGPQSSGPGPGWPRAGPRSRDGAQAHSPKTQQSGFSQAPVFSQGSWMILLEARLRTMAFWGLGRASPPTSDNVPDQGLELLWPRPTAAKSAPASG